MNAEGLRGLTYNLGFVSMESTSADGKNFLKNDMFAGQLEDTRGMS